MCMISTRSKEIITLYIELFKSKPVQQSEATDKTCERY